MQYVGVTGFMSRAEVDAALEALPAGLTLMCGVLVSAATLAGIKNKWWKRYAPPAQIADIFSPDPRCLNLIHYCADEPPNLETISRLQDLGGERLHGFQFNGAWPSASSFRLAVGRAPMHVVLQARPGQFDANEMRSFMTTITDGCRHVLLDVSGGRGEAFDLASTRMMVRNFRCENGYWLSLGVAGGLCAETLPAALAPLAGYDVSIDAEGRLRDGDEGGVLNLDKVRAYLAAAGEVMLPGDRERM